MIARRLRPEEYWWADLNKAVAFESPFEFEKERDKAVEYNPKEELYGAFPEEGGPCAASLVMNRKDVRFDGHVLGMAGMGGVATLPAQRRSGAIRACMEVSLREMRDEGRALAHLYPFSTAFYRKFGFAAAGQSVRWQIKLQDLRGLPEAGGRVRQLLPGDDLSPLLEVYDRMYGGVNLSCLRETFDEDLEGDKPLREKRWVFLWEDEGGRPGAFLAGVREGDVLSCVTDFATGGALLFTDTQALMGLLSFIHTAFIANFKSIRFAVPPHIDLTALLPEVSGMDCKYVLNGMVRAINVETLLRCCRCMGEGELTLAVSDPILPENCGGFRLRFAPGAENRVERTDAPPDVSLDVGDLAALLCGARGTESIALTPDITVHRKVPALGQVFYRKPCHVLDLY